jgi:hypothetical protein
VEERLGAHIVNYADDFVICCRSSAQRARAVMTDMGEVVMRLNRMMTGWANYFCLGPVSKACHAVDQHARGRLRQWLRKKHQMPGRATSGGLEHDAFSESRMRENRPSGSMSGTWKRSVQDATAPRLDSTRRCPEDDDAHFSRINGSESSQRPAASARGY